MRVLRDDDLIGGRREHHVANVHPIRPPADVNPRHPSLYRRTDTVLFDQTDPDLNAAADCVLLTKPEAVRIAALLHAARTHLPSPRAADEAIELLTQSSRSTW